MKRVLASIGFGLALVSCAGPAAAPSFPTPVPSPTQIGKLTLQDSACTFETAGTPLRAGPISLAIFNQTQGIVVVDLGRIADGHTFEELAANNRKAREAAAAGGPQVDRPSYFLGYAPLQLGPGGSTNLIETSIPGTHVIVCLRMYANLGEFRPYGIVGPLEIK